MDNTACPHNASTKNISHHLFTLNLFETTQKWYLRESQEMQLNGLQGVHLPLLLQAACRVFPHSGYFWRRFATSEHATGVQPSGSERRTMLSTKAATMGCREALAVA